MHRLGSDHVKALLQGPHLSVQENSVAIDQLAKFHSESLSARPESSRCEVVIQDGDFEKRLAQPATIRMGCARADVSPWARRRSDHPRLPANETPDPPAGYLRLGYPRASGIFCGGKYATT